jgi:hypothetical protein
VTALVLTMGFYQIILVLLQQWLANPVFVPSSPRIRKRRLSLATHGSVPDMQSADPPIRRQSYPVINSVCHCATSIPALSVDVSLDLLRVIRKGPAVKEAVDDAIDQCAEVLNLRDSIEEARIRAEQVTDGREKRSLAQRGLLHRSPQINIFLIALKAFKICGDTSSSSFSRHSCNPQSRIPCKRTRRSKPL